ncbi:MAG: DUF1566 domain-containing protein [Proteobacteria bacterium]|nr:DUF1566 domain-containing protein [Pseudomonadota bacterium]MBU1232556.1 DUF1566 domain-containing protein [Pseudomonadota bacterium]MBU1418006.1 DUF1566 domain-containing protein [Pseudomonadota bacterium]MBU1455943.1 DUF1566 domain-containing protein [Pseudomonadota bacterium]
MRPVTIYRFALLFMLVVGCFFSLSSCHKSTATADRTVSSKEMLLKDMGNGVCRQLPSGLMWQIKESQKFSTWNEANEYVNTLKLGGFDDWRLPTRDECLNLSELLEMKKGDCPIKIKAGHWVSNKNKGESGYWEDYPLCGGSEFRWVKDKKGSVRGVRPSK